MHSLWKIVAKTSLAKAYGLFSNILFIAITARYLGPEGRGELVAITTWVMAFSTFCYLSLGQVVIRDAARAEGGDWFSDALGALVFWALVMSVTGWLIAFVLYWVTGGAIYGGLNPMYLTIGFGLLPFLIWFQYSTSVLTAMSRLDIHNRFVVLGKTVKLLVFVTLVFLFDDILALALVATILGDALVAAGGIQLFRRTLKSIVLINWERNLRLLRDGLTLHLNAIGNFLFSASDILMLNYYRSSEETGFYQLGFQITMMMMIVPQAANLVIYGKIVSLGPDRAWVSFHRKIFVQVFFLVVVGAIFVGLTAPWWLVWIAGEEFRPTLDILHWQLLAVVGMTFSSLMASQWIGRGYFWQASSLTFFVGICNLLANSILIPRYGMHGAIWASLMAYTLSLIANGAMILHCNKVAKLLVQEAD
jgi:O-antigen/teichoic acid export membrane protein